MSDGVVVAGFTVRARRPDGSSFLIGPVDVTIAAGERVLLVGPSGSGKSLLLATLAGLRPRAIVAGTGRVGRPLGSVSARDGLLLDRSALDNVAAAAVAVTRDNTRDNTQRDDVHHDALTRSLDVLHQLGIADCAHRLPSLLSGGQRRRLALARALVVSPGVLLLDDPTAGLDPDTAAEVLDVAARLAPDAAVLVACQDPDVVGPWASRAIMLSVVNDDGSTDGSTDVGSTDGSTNVRARVMPVSRLPPPWAPRPFPSFLGTAVTP